jgi:hypothetical protein
MAQDGAEGLGCDEARQKSNLLEWNAGRSRRTRGRMDMSLLQAQAQWCEGPCPRPLCERVRHGRPGEVALDILAERGWETLPSNSDRGTPVVS